MSNASTRSLGISCAGRSIIERITDGLDDPALSNGTKIALDIISANKYPFVPLREAGEFSNDAGLKRAWLLFLNPYRVA